MLQQNAKLIASDGEAVDLFGISVAVRYGGGGGRTKRRRQQHRTRLRLCVREALRGMGGLLTEDAKLTASDGRPVDFLGNSVALSGDTVVVNSPGDDVGENRDQGSAYVFVKPAGGWAGQLQENAKLVASDGATNDRFLITIGGSVAVSGDTVVVGADGTNSNQGSAYVFVKPIGGWAGLLQENAKLTASDGAAGNLFGFSVGASGDTAVVGTFATTPARPAYVFVEPPGGFDLRRVIHVDSAWRLRV